MRLNSTPAATPCVFVGTPPSAFESFGWELVAELVDFNSRWRRAGTARLWQEKGDFCVEGKPKKFEAQLSLC